MDVPAQPRRMRRKTTLFYWNARNSFPKLAFQPTFRTSTRVPRYVCEPKVISQIKNSFIWKSKARRNLITFGSFYLVSFFFLSYQSIVPLIHFLKTEAPTAAFTNRSLLTSNLYSISMRVFISIKYVTFSSSTNFPSRRTTYGKSSWQSVGKTDSFIFRFFPLCLASPHASHARKGTSVIIVGLTNDHVRRQVNSGNCRK